MSRRWMAICGFLAVGIGIASVARAADAARADRLADLGYRFLYDQQGWGVLGINCCAHVRKEQGLPLTVNGRQYDTGLGHHAPGEIVIDLAGEYATFESIVGVQTLAGGAGSVVFQVFVDDRQRFDSGVMKQDSPAQRVSVSLRGAQELRLVVTDAGDGLTNDCANWVDARLMRADVPAALPAGSVLDAAPFGDVVTCDPTRMDGARSTRIQEYRAEDVYLETPVVPDSKGNYHVAATGGKAACLGLKWIERRRLRTVGFEFAEGSARPRMGDVRLECWAGRSSWQGEWKPVRGEWQAQDAVWTLRPDWSSVPDARGETRKIRFIFPESVAIRRLTAVTSARLEQARLHVELERPLGNESASVDIYNGEFAGTGGPLRREWSPSEPLSIDLRHAKPRPWLPDKTVLRFHLPAPAGPVAEFGVSVDDVLKDGCVYVRDLGLFVAVEPVKMPLADYKKQIANRQTILQQVRTMPDQTLAQVIAAIHNPAQNLPPTLLSLACDNHKFIVHREGRIEFSSAPETDDKHVGDLPDLSAQISPTFGSGKNEKLSRGLDGGWMPILITSVEENGIAYRQRTFVAPLGQEASASLNAAASVGVMELTAENVSANPAAATLSLAFWANAKQQDVAEVSAVPTGAVAYRRGRLLAAVQADQARPLKLDVTESGARLTGTLPPRVTSRLVVFVPTVVMRPEQHTQFGNPDDLLRATREYWTRQLAPAMQVELPDPLLANTIKASQVHCLIAARGEEKGSRVAPWIASVSYGPLESESNSIIRGMDFFGHHEFARRSLDFFIHRYSPDGMLTTGYTLMGTGWHLWMLGEHYGLARDRDWLRNAAPNVARVCKWIVQQRAKTMKPWPDGSKPPEFGLMPPGIMADWDAFAYYFCLNGYYCAGLRSAADALADVDVADAAAWREVASRFRDDILRGFAWTRALMPVYRLRDGTSVPGYPSQLHGPGPTANFFPGEDGNRSWCYDVELGSHHLVPLGILDANSRETAWMMDHMEDVQFLSDGWFDFPAELSAKDWYNRGGFAKVQPYYCRNAEVCALRDDVKPFIRTYFN
ncbi:MAG: NPCBM/NEW2 domain-containing protein, partial [Planctomycetes bacterium]|nr:NPCBM/NEW2 domain-containing protein [Planctomycetota bacterium]